MEKARGILSLNFRETFQPMPLPSFIPVLLLFFAAGLTAQNAPFPQENARWCYARYGDLGNYEYTFCYQPDSLVSVQGETYARINYDGQTWLYRETSGRFYVWPQDSAQERLVYDFNLAFGDTFVVQWGRMNAGANPMMQVYAVDTIVTIPDGLARKRITLGNDQGSYCVWIEGIGTDRCDFLYPTYYLSVSGDCLLECFSVASTVLYPESAPGSTCPFVSSVQTPLRRLPEVHVRPNPATDHFELICSLDTPGTISMALFNSLGQRVYHQAPRFFPAGEARISVHSGMPGKGVYQLRLESEQGIVWRTLVLQP